ncbi:hypothetical protein [Vallitalea maricola]|uniref:Uncharacterized protein n=1 Tax=Vallitalea maricola TaxID=3074433 RepID=A0ACB5UGK1_9FIRM|nr:hypothetical protein AN2V17_10060 [Vallitalea sp. AN17-2]
MKKILTVFLMAIIILNTSAISYAKAPIDLNEIYANVDANLNLTVEQVEGLSEDELNQYFKEVYSVDPSEFTYEDKMTAVEAAALLSGIQRFNSMRSFDSSYERVYTTKSAINNCNYTGSKGLAWVRDTTKDGSPLSLGEILSGVYTLEVDFLPYTAAATIYALGSDYNFFVSVKNAAGTAAASALICSKLKIEATIPAAVISFAVSMGWDILNALDRDAMKDVLLSMDASDLMKVDFVTANKIVTKCYSKYTTEVEWIDSEKCFKYLDIENPTGKSGNWYGGQPGYLYSY